MKFYDFDDNNVLQTTAETVIFWDSSNEPSNYSWSQILYDIRKADAKQNLFLEPITEKEILDYYAEQILTFDALVVQNNRLEKEMRVFERLMNNAATNIKISAMQQTSPFTKNGVANVCNIFELSDGQTITIFFHSPDTTPKKITPTDNLISYKWVLNKKDITIVVAPERGKDLNVREVCRRIMKLAEKNSAAFARANKNRAEKAQKLADTESEIAQLEKQLADLQQQLEVAKVKRDELQIATAEQSSNDFRDDGVKVSIKNNEKLQEVNNVQPVDENLKGEEDFDAEKTFFELVKTKLSSRFDIKTAAKNNSSLRDFMKYYNHEVETLMVNRYADINDNRDSRSQAEKEFFKKMLNDDNLRINTFKDFGEELYNKYHAETAENNSQNLVENNAENNVTEPQQIESENEIVIDTNVADRIDFDVKFLKHYYNNTELLREYVEEKMCSNKNFLRSFKDVPSLLNSILQKFKRADYILFDKFLGDENYIFIEFHNANDKIILDMTANTKTSSLTESLFLMLKSYSEEFKDKEYTGTATKIPAEKAYAIAEKYFQNYLSNK